MDVPLGHCHWHVRLCYFHGQLCISGGVNLVLSILHARAPSNSNKKNVCFASFHSLGQCTMAKGTANTSIPCLNI